MKDLATLIFSWYVGGIGSVSQYQSVALRAILMHISALCLAALHSAKSQNKLLNQANLRRNNGATFSLPNQMQNTLICLSELLQVPGGAQRERAMEIM